MALLYFVNLDIIDIIILNIRSRIELINEMK